MAYNKESLLEKGEGIIGKNYYISIFKSHVEKFSGIKGYLVENL